MVELMAPNGVTVQARDGAVQRLLDSGFVRVETKSPAPKRRRTAKKTARG